MKPNNEPLTPVEQRQAWLVSMKQRTYTNVMLTLIALPIMLSIVVFVLAMTVCGACSRSSTDRLDPPPARLYE